MVYYNYRYYSTYYGRWISFDQVDNYNLYNYCGNKLKLNDKLGLSVLIYDFAHSKKLRKEADRLNEDVKNRIITHVKEKNMTYEKLSQSCRGEVDLFEWFRKQGVEITFKGKLFHGTTDEYIKKIESYTLDYEEATHLTDVDDRQQLKEELSTFLPTYDYVVIHAHGKEAHNRKPDSIIVEKNETNYEITIPQKDFDDYVLICCYQGDGLERSFQTSPPVIDYDIEFHDAQGNSKYRHYKKGYISYIPPSIYCKIGV